MCRSCSGWRWAGNCPSNRGCPRCTHRNRRPCWQCRRRRTAHPRRAGSAARRAIAGGCAAGRNRAGDAGHAAICDVSVLDAGAGAVMGARQTAGVAARAAGVTGVARAIRAAVTMTWPPAPPPFPPPSVPPAASGTPLERAEVQPVTPVAIAAAMMVNPSSCLPRSRMAFEVMSLEVGRHRVPIFRRLIRERAPDGPSWRARLTSTPPRLGTRRF